MPRAPASRQCTFLTKELEVQPSQRSSVFNTLLNYTGQLLDRTPFNQIPERTDRPHRDRRGSCVVLWYHICYHLYVSEIREYLDERGRSPFGRWFDHLDPLAAARINTALSRLQTGNTSSVRSVGEGVLESRINFGPGYRVYFGRDGHTLIILLGGGTKQRQQADIERARILWREYRKRS